MCTSLMVPSWILTLAIGHLSILQRQRFVIKFLLSSPTTTTTFIMYVSGRKHLRLGEPDLCPRSTHDLANVLSVITCHRSASAALVRRSSISAAR
ncbi:hypothetical protein LXA43DRAFT_670532 [Ganoderma leucocontextum]|nr:hypothetical protein LXA43DRAFT_670532 [Ganoderma leucocontextum]